MDRLSEVCPPALMRKEGPAALGESDLLSHHPQNRGLADPICVGLRSAPMRGRTLDGLSPFLPNRGATLLH